jgi:hypothetical protein
MTVIDLAKYMRAREIASRPQATAPIWIGDHTSQSKDRDEHVIGTDWGAVPDEGGTLSARVLQKLDRNAQLSKFFELAANATSHINECIDLLEQQDNLAADDQFMAGKQIFAELLMFRDISDSVGLVLLRCFQAASQVRAVTDVPTLPRTILRVLNRISTAPFMNFEEACSLADEIEHAAGRLSMPGYNELSEQLIAESETEIA